MSEVSSSLTHEFVFEACPSRVSDLSSFGFTISLQGFQTLTFDNETILLVDRNSPRTMSPLKNNKRVDYMLGTIGQKFGFCSGAWVETRSSSKRLFLEPIFSCISSGVLLSSLSDPLVAY